MKKQKQPQSETTGSSAPAAAGSDAKRPRTTDTATASSSAPAAGLSLTGRRELLRPGRQQAHPPSRSWNVQVGLQQQTNVAQLPLDHKQQQLYSLVRYCGIRSVVLQLTAHGRKTHLLTPHRIVQTPLWW